MNYFEFRQQLAQDSQSQDEEFLRMIREDAKCAQAYKEAMAFENTLKQAFKIKAPENLKDQLVLTQATKAYASDQFRKFAMAASLFLTVSLSSGVWYFNQPGPLEKFVTQAIKVEPIEYISKDQIPQEEVQSLFASLNTKVDGDLGDVHFMKMCKTPGGMGARMVLMTDIGPVTILYMPKADIEKNINFEVENYNGSLIAMEKGVAAIIGDHDQSLASIESKLISTLKPLN